MSKRNVLMLLLAAVLLTAFSVALSKRDSRDWRANRSRRLFPFPWQDTVSLTIEKPDGQRFDFKKLPKGEWQILLPDDLQDVLNYRAVDSLSALATLTWREPLQDGAAPVPGQAVRMTAVSNSGQRLSLAFGEVRNNLRAVCVDDDASTVFGVNQDLLNFLDWPSDRFRNYYLASAGGAAKPKRILIAPPGGDENLRIELVRAENGWEQIRPVRWPVDETRLDILIRWAEKLRAASIEAEMSGDLEWFGFDEKSAYVEVTFDNPAGEIARRVDFGKEIDDSRMYARVEGRSPIFSIPSEVFEEASLNIAAEHPGLWKNFYRQRAMNVVGDVIPASVTIERLLPTPSKLTVTQVRDRDIVRWTGSLESGGTTRTFSIEPPDGNEPMRPLTALFTGLSNLRVKAFLADTAPGPDTIKWTAFPAWRFSYQTFDGAKSPAVLLYAANAEGEIPPGAPFIPGEAGAQEMRALAGYPEKVGIAFSIEDRPAVMETFPELAYLLCLPPYRYQSRKMLDYDPKFWGKIEILYRDATRAYFRRSGEVNEQWWLDSTTPEPLMDDNNRFVTMLVELSQLRSDGFVEDMDGDIEKFGLDQPEITAIVYTSKDRAAPDDRDGLLFKLTIGAPSSVAGSRYARLNDEGPIFLVPGRLCEGLGDTYR